MAGKGRWPSRPRPWQAVAVAETAGDVRSVGIVHASATGSSREGHGSVTGLRPRHGNRGKSTLPRMLSNSHGHDASFVVAMATTKLAARFSALHPGPKSARRCLKAAGSVEFPASSSTTRALRGISRASLSRKSDLGPSLHQHPHEPLTSWASHGGHSLPGSP